MVYLLRQNKPYFHEKFVHGRFVWLITGLKPDLYWWDVVILARKVSAEVHSCVPAASHG